MSIPQQCGECRDNCLRQVPRESDRTSRTWQEHWGLQQDHLKVICYSCCNKQSLSPADTMIWKPWIKSSGGPSHSWTPRSSLCEALKPVVLIQPSASKEPEKLSNQNQLWGRFIESPNLKKKEVLTQSYYGTTAHKSLKLAYSWVSHVQNTRFPPVPLARGSSSACHCQDTGSKLPVTFPCLLHHTLNIPACF